MKESYHISAVRMKAEYSSDDLKEGFVNSLWMQKIYSTIERPFCVPACRP
jgi:hypothetical protein